MSSKGLALTGMIIAGLLALPFFITAMIAEIFDGTNVMIPFALWLAAAVAALIGTIGIFKGRDGTLLAASGGVMMLIPMALAMWAGWGEAAIFGLPGLLLAIAGILPQASPEAEN